MPDQTLKIRRQLREVAYRMLRDLDETEGVDLYTAVQRARQLMELLRLDLSDAGAGPAVRDSYTLQIRILSHQDHVAPAANRLRMALKNLERAHGIKVTDIRELQDPPAANTTA